MTPTTTNLPFEIERTTVFKAEMSIIENDNERFYAISRDTEYELKNTLNQAWLNKGWNLISIQVVTMSKVL